jgi:Ca2+-binding EF-hand superfamily protein
MGKIYLAQQVLIDKTMREFDKDGSGTITKDELPALMAKMMEPGE